MPKKKTKPTQAVADPANNSAHQPETARPADKPKKTIIAAAGSPAQRSPQRR
jgi:hypothetical protein